VAQHYLDSIGIHVDLETWRRNSWWHRHAAVLEAIKSLPRSGEPVILVDDGTLELGPIGGRSRIPFLERDGVWWGPPPDDATAIAELERLQGGGAAFLVFAWPAFWWLQHYTGFSRHLRANCACLLDKEWLIVFELRPSGLAGEAV
jgi:hypothetical protein